MRRNRLNSLTGLVLIILTVALFIAGGLGIERELIEIAGLIFSLLLLIFAFYQKKLLILPKGFLLFALFLGLLFVNLAWSGNYKATLEYIVLLAAGGLFWLSFYNLQDKMSRFFPKLIIFLGLAFGALFFYQQVVMPDKIIPWSLYAESNAYENHNHIGDLWAVVLVISLHQFFAGSERRLTKSVWGGFLLASSYFIALSLSRAAVLASAAGIGAGFYKQSFYKKYKRFVYLLLFFGALLFLCFGTQKSIIFSRPYYIQAIMGIYHNLLGVGMGNFSAVSSNPENWLLGLSGFSSIAHNIVLEVFAGIGVLGLVFVYWLYKVSVEIWQEKGNIIHKAVYFAILVNFLFDSTYFIPTMPWLWFITIGIA